LEPDRQSEIISSGTEWAIPDGPASSWWLSGMRGSRNERIEKTAADRTGAGHYGGPSKKLSAIE
jgi:hypothetical protein